MLAQSIRGALDFDDDGVMEEAVEQSGGEDVVADDVAPVPEAAIGGEDEGALFVPCVDELEEQGCPAGLKGQIADFID